MDARFNKFLGALLVIISSVQCSKKAETITTEAKAQALSSMSVLAAKTTCVPNAVIDENDIPGLIGGGYVYDGSTNQYCLPGGSTPIPGGDNCIPEQFLDPQDITVITGDGYAAGENNEYCNFTPPVVEPPVVTPPVVVEPPVVTPPVVVEPPVVIPPVVVEPPVVTPPVVEPPVVLPPVVVEPPVVTPPVVVEPPIVTPPIVEPPVVTPPVVVEPPVVVPPVVVDPPEEPQLPQWQIPNDRLCSKMRSGNGRYILVSRDELIVQVVRRVTTTVQKHDHSGHSCNDKDRNKHTTSKVVSYEVMCEFKDTDKIRNSIIKNKKLDLSGCDISGYSRKDIFLTLFSPVTAKDLPISKYDYDNTRFFGDNSEKRGDDVISFILLGSREYRYMQIDQKLTVIVDNNPDGESNDPKHCDQKASPLIVHVNPDGDVPMAVKLSSIASGIWFDILGRNAEPKAHTKKQISWLDSNQYMFLVKPNSKGQVSGVDEMFGDNTFGPDADFAANGFAALAKFDGMSIDGKTKVGLADGVINSEDPIYDKLRLWNDKNKNGVSERGELYKLRQMKVKAIDLEFDASYREQDRYGNETVYKSVIQYEDGSLDLIFDLWFNYKN
ncbi:MAG: hypothetical protein IT287_04145 [Bdellovibrionaceae bacterium]|nr:hypothetical protein [Pseudobdellovibrionaceae bacterium]